jgi:hypothetical protein
MPAPRSLPARLGLALAALFGPASAAEPDQPDPHRLTVVDRAVAQGPAHSCRSSWQVDYTLRYDGPSPLVARPAEVVAEVRGSVSNSRVASHATPRSSSLTISGASGLSAYAEVIASADPDQRCRERGVLQVWAGPRGSEPPDPIAKAGLRTVRPEEQPTIEVPPGGTLRARLRLEHDHFLYGPHDPLLGPRSVELRVGPASLRDALVLDRPRSLARPDPAWSPRASSDRLDTRIFVTPPDSLHLEAHVAGNQSHCFPERPIRYATKYRLSYWYLIAPGTEGECRARVSQYRDGSVWKALHEGEFEQPLTVVGRWARIERVFRTEPDATTLRLEFRMHDSHAGDLWIDDVRLEPLADPADGP